MTMSGAARPRNWLSRQRDRPVSAAPARPRPQRIGRGGPVPPLGPGLQLARAILVMMLVMTAGLLAEFLVVSRLQHNADQTRAFDAFRGELARGTAPRGGIDADGALLEDGTPMALIEIPAIGLSEVIGEGTSADSLFDGPGHRRDTPFPGQTGVSVVFGRRTTFGAPFAHIDTLDAGDTITVTTAQGEFDYTVTGVRFEGQALPPPLAPGGGRLTLATAGGWRWLPDGVLRVDADLVGAAVGGPARISSRELPGHEQPMASDTRTLWTLALWLQALIVLSVGAVWAWNRWGRAQAWIVFLPALTLVGLAASGEVARLLPNLS
jgi:sortase A